MNSSYFANPVIFLLDTVFFLYMLLVALRFLMPWAMWDARQPTVQFIVRATDPPLRILRQAIPAFGRFDTSCFLLLLVIAAVKTLFIMALQAGVPGIGMIIMLSLAEVFSLFITLFTVTIIIEVILSWLNPPGTYNPVAHMITRLNAPLLSPVRRAMPDMGGLDLSPLVVIIGLQILSMLVMPILTGQV